MQHATAVQIMSSLYWRLRISYSLANIVGAKCVDCEELATFANNGHNKNNETRNLYCHTIFTTSGRLPPLVLNCTCHYQVESLSLWVTDLPFLILLVPCLLKLLTSVRERSYRRRLTAGWFPMLWRWQRGLQNTWLKLLDDPLAAWITSTRTWHHRADCCTWILHCHIFKCPWTSKKKI